MPSSSDTRAGLARSFSGQKTLIVPLRRDVARALSSIARSHVDRSSTAESGSAAINWLPADDTFKLEKSKLMLDLFSRWHRGRS
jgi:hypothetical protein